MTSQIVEEQIDHMKKHTYNLKYKTYPRHACAGPMIDHDRFVCGVCHRICQ